MTDNARPKVGVVSLGCDKNRVDSENILGFLRGHCDIVTDYAQCDVVIINTCAFLQSAVKEAIDVIMEAAATGVKIIVTGCLPMRYANIAQDNLMPEVSAFLDNQHYADIVQTVYTVLGGGRVVGKNKGAKPTDISPDRVLTTPLHYAYLKVAEGCNNRCAYCAIPAIRGPYVSTPLPLLVDEAERLAARGVTELILVAQDVTRYAWQGADLMALLDALEATDIAHIRLMYCYPDKVDKALLDRIENDPKLCRYIDIPMQHASDSVLRAMRRHSTAAQLTEMMDYIRANTHIRVRSTFMVGFPGETQDDVDCLIAFLQRYRLEYAGFFAFSAEEGTPAYTMPQLPAAVKRQRKVQVEKVQSAIMRQIAQSYVGQVLEVTLDVIDMQNECFVGHTDWMHPETDNKVYFTASFPVVTGQTYRVRIDKVRHLDLVGEAVEEVTNALDGKS